jgi:Family of unknown function (DUF6183)
MDRVELDRLIDHNNPDELVLFVDRLTGAGDWAGLLTVMEACRAAASTGRQLWPVASLAQYRLALRAPGQWAAEVLREGFGWFALGPLSEVAASTHAWIELSPWLEPGPVGAYVAHERVLHGEDLRDADADATAVLELPLVLEPWEGPYALPIYLDDKAKFDPPPSPVAAPVALPGADAPQIDGDDGAMALAELVGHWVSQSDGRVEVRCVHGDHLAAITALGVPRARVEEIDVGRAFAWMAWGAASGGAHGRRRGGAAGRFNAWWVATMLAGLEWPPEPAVLGEVAGELKWFWWDPSAPRSVWQLHLAVWDEADDVAWALSAVDQ